MTKLPESIPLTMTASAPPSLPPPRTLRYWLTRAGAAAAVALATILVLARGDVSAVVHVLAQDWSPQPPDWTPLVEAGAVIWIHVATVAAALAVGVVLMVGRKGRRLHRILGWIWASLMVATAIATLFIRSTLPGATFGFSLLHIFSVSVLISAPLGVYYARRHNVARHRSAMTGLFLGGLIVAGTLTFLPGRIMHEVFFG